MASILLFNASNSSQSIHDKVLDAVQQLLQAQGQQPIERQSMRDYELPLLSLDREREQGYPEPAQAFYALLAAHEALAIACPEHNGSVPAAFKNLLDWTSRYARHQPNKMFEGRQVLLLSTSGGANGGASNLAHLAKLLPWQGASRVVTCSLGGFYERFPEGQPNEATREELQQAVQQWLA
ncbi:NADPH-dependent fmn reductase [Vandammella animalimorsus]|uniref:NADPH-dependent fmn reductase n=1 Tax=Vandammella animalimorsus TaxID=2029117 RepID=A0A2A2T747_9BURK|nr:NADPH-dependent FMN reductase [Vandammella animalimorsus]PAT32096.1 NADPH-dependent fmn reductase [Vandammella animalimorsus]PAX17115.1 NADPH-dependent fmn reductase [Vandammella animalimorsus]PAX19088.1 NADPH-dependent fmn reductase [Vandammella animalimorsus]